MATELLHSSATKRLVQAIRFLDAAAAMWLWTAASFLFAPAMFQGPAFSVV
jgi:hypothetical protein